MTHFKIYLITFAVFAVLPAKAQQLLTQRQAIDTALRNSYDIQIARNNAEISRMSNTPGMAGVLPTVNINSSYIGSYNTKNQKLSDNSTSQLGPLFENNASANISAGITLFNGFRIQAAKNRLDLLRQQSETMLNRNIQRTMANVILQYSDIIRQQNYLNIIKFASEVSKKKLEIVDAKSNVGMAAGSEMLQSKTDLNTALQQVNSQLLAINQNKAELLSLMQVNKIFPFDVENEIAIDTLMNWDTIAARLNRNPDYEMAARQVQIQENYLKEVQSQRYPALKLNAGYGISNYSAPKGNTLYNRTYGPTGGLTLQVPIFNGSVAKTQESIARINLDNAKLDQAGTLNDLKTQAYKLYQAYSTSLEQLKLQKENYELAKKLVELVMQRFQVNQATILEVKAAQTSYENAAYSLVNLQYATKVAETQLKLLTFSIGN